MNIRGFIDTSFVDWDGMVSCVVFTGGCNLRCGYCYNFGLVLHPEKFDRIPEESVLSYLTDHSDFLDGVCITGGEPTMQSDLIEFCKQIKRFGLGIKLDTNGTKPQLLKQLIDQGLVDFVAMDVKARLDEALYSDLAGVSLNGSMDDIKRSIQVIIDSGVDHEFRTTVVPGFHSEEEIRQISMAIANANCYRLQKFQPHTRLDDLNQFHPQTDEEMEELAQIARQHVKNVEWRGR
jgi:pyruvate formate lyase activating enzyme